MPFEWLAGSSVIAAAPDDMVSGNALFEFSDPDGAFSSCLSISSCSTLIRLCLSLTSSANKLVSLILLLKSSFRLLLEPDLAGVDGDRARLVRDVP